MAVYRFIQFFIFFIFSAILEECKYTQDRIDVVLQLYQVCFKKKVNGYTFKPVLCVLPRDHLNRVT